MYAGEVNVAQDQLPAFLKTAERLKVKGLAEAPQNIKQEWFFLATAAEADQDFSEKNAVSFFC